MAANPYLTYLGRLIVACLAVAGLFASEHHGIVKSGGLPVPGATVIATMGDKKVATTTDDNGAYGFPNLEDGVWTLNIEMLGFAKVTREVAVAPEAPSGQWDLKLLSADAMKAAIAAALAPPPAAAAASQTPATPATTATATPAPATTTPTANASG